MARPTQNQDVFRATSYKYPDDLGSSVGAEQNYMIFDAYKANIVDGVAASTSPDTSIALYIPPGALKTNYASKYATMEGYRQLISAGQEASKQINQQALEGGAEFSAETYMKTIGSQVTENFMSAAGRKIAESAMKKSDIAKALSVGAGIARNPFISVFFEGPGDFRKFSFSFDLIPRNKHEAKTIRKIVTAFKVASLAEELNAGTPNAISYFLGYPRQWEIKFYILEDPFGQIQDRTKKLFRIGRCVCTDIAVDYGGSGIPQFFDNGEPFHTKLDLSFQEIHLLTANKVRADNGQDSGY
jgi:hypothetical protein